ncbi:serine/threonine protein kinase, FIKK family [Plasmodium sp. gorilla clade G3]|nr:serine/threonine protein kinase, FIKK family [Plasmodium sp. gorilla clade G3]
MLNMIQKKKTSFLRSILIKFIIISFLGILYLIFCNVDLLGNKESNHFELIVRGSRYLAERGKDFEKKNDKLNNKNVDNFGVRGTKNKRVINIDETSGNNCEGISKLIVGCRKGLKKFWNKICCHSLYSEIIYSNNDNSYNNDNNIKNKSCSINNDLLINESQVNNVNLKEDDDAIISRNFKKSCANEINNMNEEQDSKNIYSWDLGKESLGKLLDSSKNFSINGVKYEDWEMTQIPTCGASRIKEKCQKMYKVIIKSKGRDDKVCNNKKMGNCNDCDKNKGKDNQEDGDIKLFIKKVPIDIWVKQYDLMKEYYGEYLLVGENFVMESVVLAFLNEHHPGIAPKFYKFLYEPDMNYDINNNCGEKNTYAVHIDTNLDTFNETLREQVNNNKKGYVVMVSEFFGEDVFDYTIIEKDRLETEEWFEDVKKILFKSLKLLIRLHDAGITHLDLTPENILITKNLDMRFCDFGKSAPVYTTKLRHTKEMNKTILFESCQPNIGKNPNTPPECWDLFLKYESLDVEDPLEYLKTITDPEERKMYYFDVRNADKYMLGIFFIFLWNDGYLWDSAEMEDDDYSKFMKSDMNFDSFELTKSWPQGLKVILKQLLDENNRKNLNFNDLVIHPWWSYKN